MRATRVIFFRNQAHLDDSGQEAFAARLGTPVAHPTVPVADGTRFVLELDSRDGDAATAWHTDVTFLPNYPEASILRGIEIPKVGGDTLWANTVSAYEELPEPLKALVANLRSHSYQSLRLRQRPLEPRHPNRGSGTVPCSPRRSMRRSIRWFASTRNRANARCSPVISSRGSSVWAAPTRGDCWPFFQDHITQPENTVRWRWRAGDVAIWDNRATQHRAVADFGKQRRHLRRVALDGPVARGIDGQPSRLLDVRAPRPL